METDAAYDSLNCTPEHEEAHLQWLESQTPKLESMSTEFASSSSLSTKQEDGNELTSSVIEAREATRKATIALDATREAAAITTDAVQKVVRIKQNLPVEKSTVTQSSEEHTEIMETQQTTCESIIDEIYVLEDTYSNSTEQNTESNKVFMNTLESILDEIDALDNLITVVHEENTQTIETSPSLSDTPSNETRISQQSNSTTSAARNDIDNIPYTTGTMQGIAVVNRLNHVGTIVDIIMEAVEIFTMPTETSESNEEE